MRHLTKLPFAVNFVAGVGEALKYSQKVVNVVIEEAIPVAIVSVGRPEVYTRVLKDAGIKVLPYTDPSTLVKQMEQRYAGGRLPG